MATTIEHNHVFGTKCQRGCPLFAEGSRLWDYRHGEGFTHFIADCGHEWIAPDYGSWECPFCGRYEGDHHLVSYESVNITDIPVGLICHSLAIYYDLAQEE